MSPYRSFAQRMSALDQMTKLETGISTALKMSKVPPKETKKMLTSKDAEQVRNTPLFQFMQMLFTEIGLGDLDIEKASDFSYVFTVEDSPVPKLIPDAKGKKTCYITAEMFSSFFSEDLGLSASSDEIKCKSEGHERCEFLVKVNALQAYQIALDEDDRKIIGMKIENPSMSISRLGEELRMEDEEVEYRMDILRRYGIMDENLRVTEIGVTYYRYRLNTPVKEDVDFEPPWTMMREISSAIAAARSFAEAMSEQFKEEKKVLTPEEEEKIVNLVDESKKSRSFAELLAKQMKEEKEE